MIEKLSPLQIESRIKVLGKELTLKLSPLSGENNYPLFIGLMDDCFMFFADLIRTVDLDLTCDFINGEIGKVDVSGKNIVLVLGKAVEIKNLKKNIHDLGASSITTVCFTTENKADFDFVAF